MKQNAASVDGVYQNKSCSECQKTLCQYVKMQLFSLGIKMKVVQNVRQLLCHYVNMFIGQYFNMSICQNATFQLSYQNESCSECQNDIRKHHIGMSTCQYVNMSVCQYVDMSECNFSA